MIKENEEENWSSEMEYTKKLSDFTMGKKLGRPRKVPKINHFFDYCCKTKRHKKSHKVNKQQKRQLKIQSLTPAQQSLPSNSVASNRALEPSQLAKEILETSQLMGLVINSNRDEALKVIEENLGLTKVCAGSETLGDDLV